MPSLASPWTRGRRGRLVLASLGFSLHQACEAIVPLTVGVVIDIGIAGSDAAGLAIGVGALTVVFLALLFSWRMGELAAMRLFIEMDYSTRRSLLARALDPLARVRRRGGESLSTLTTDVGEASSAAWAIGRGIAHAVAVAVAGTGLLLVSVPLGLTVLVTMPLLVFAVHRATGPLERRRAVEQASLAESSALTTDLLSGLRTVKGLGAETEATRRFGAANARTLSAALRTANAEGLFAGVSSLLSGLFLVALALLSSSAVLVGAITVGQLVTVVGLAQFLQGPVAGLGFVGAELATVRASRRRIDDLAETAATDDRPLPSAPRGTVRFADVHAGSVLGLDLEIPAGALVGIEADEADAIIVSELLAGAAAPASGAVLIDGEPLTRPPRPGDARVVSAPHEAALLTGSVAGNVGVRDRPDIADATALADVLAVGGWDRPVGERGRLLSGGQRQRVALARALASDARVLVLREPTTAVDTATETRIAAGIRSLRAGRTTLLLTRSRTLLAACDLVVVLSEHTGERA